MCINIALKNKNMKILFCNYDLAQGGAQRRMSHLMIDLQKRGFEVTCFLLRDKRSYKELVNSNIRFYIHEESRNLICELYELIKEIRPDVVHNWAINIGGAIALIKPFLIFSYIDSTITTCNRLSKTSLSFYLQLISFVSADIIISNSMAGILVRQAPKSKSYVIYNGYDYARLTNLEDPLLIRKKLGVTTPYMIAMAARIHPQKDIAMFIDVAHILGKYRKDISFVLIGDGPQRDMFEKYCIDKNIKNIVFAGHRNDVESIYHATDICLLCSRHEEGVSNSILEAMADGIPVIATESGGTCEIIEHSNNGFIVPKGDVDTMVSYINMLLEDKILYTRIRNRAIETVKSKFLLSTMVDQYITMYTKIVQK